MSREVWPGRPFPVGATWSGEATNFSIFSENATAVCLCLFDDDGHEVPAGQARLGLLPGGVPGPAVILAVPSSYMNESGGPVKALMSFFSIPAERLIVIHDELDIDAGVVRLKSGGGEGGWAFNLHLTDFLHGGGAIDYES